MTDGCWVDRVTEPLTKRGMPSQSALRGGIRKQERVILIAADGTTAGRGYTASVQYLLYAGSRLEGHLHGHTAVSLLLGDGL